MHNRQAGSDACLQMLAQSHHEQAQANTKMGVLMHRSNGIDTCFH
jgi:hypothetical protein